MAEWVAQRAGVFTQTSDNADSPWHDGGAQTALAAYPVTGDTITNTNEYVITPGTIMDTYPMTRSTRVVIRRNTTSRERYGKTP